MRVVESQKLPLDHGDNQAHSRHSRWLRSQVATAALLLSVFVCHKRVFNAANKRHLWSEMLYLFCSGKYVASEVCVRTKSNGWLIGRSHNYLIFARPSYVFLCHVSLSCVSVSLCPPKLRTSVPVSVSLSLFACPSYVWPGAPAILTENSSCSLTNTCRAWLRCKVH